MIKKQLFHAMQKNLDVEMIYISNTNQISQRKIKVLKLNEHSMAAYCYLRKTTRTFTYSNILSCIPVIEKEPLVM
ncbi:transcriptional regulator [Jeotgalibacillus proteolyticus]|uniref:Transcriptional regulator n=1 Tax=Jeotgalibacillus proteolyticus TaxID=2082395 RepID=A0A2S5GB08_9BACL|nr:transcriptional regulator [Jeotgalibacillus proteolyticus]PPA70083.1 transcriptional regulator [Jeotgalibacillus proteolyticus]